MESDPSSSSCIESEDCESGCKCHPKKMIKVKSKSFKCVVYDGEGRDQKKLIKYVCETYKNFSYSNSLKASNILWFGKPYIFQADVELCQQIKGYINKMPGAELFKEKSTQCRILNQLNELFPEEFKFHPKSFCLPRDYEHLDKSIKENPKKLLIAKPSEGGGGGGIFLFKSIKDLSGLTWSKDCVVQRYVPNPLLINKKKWDMRTYVMIHGINPMRAYLATEYGLARFCTEDYDTSNTHNIYSHLTNYSLNKNSDAFVKGQELTEDSETYNSKMTLTDVWKLVQKHYPDVDIENDCKQKMRDLVINVLSATRSTIELKHVEFMGQKVDPKENKKYFQILGFDIMFDDNFDAWLFEVNAFPSMEILFEKDNADGSVDKERSEVDELVKGKIFADSVKILMTKEDNDTLELVYDSEDSSDSSCQLYETVFEIYKTICGVKLQCASEKSWT